MGMQVVKLPGSDEFAMRINNTIVAPEATLSEVSSFCEDARRHRFGPLSYRVLDTQSERVLRRLRDRVAYTSLPRSIL